MVEMINRVSGTHMWVAKERVSEYLKAGHKIYNREKLKAHKEPEADVPVDFMNPPVEPVTQNDEPVEKVAEPVKRGRGRGRAKK